MRHRGYRRAFVACVLAAAWLLAPPSVSGGFAWDAGIAAGYAGVVLLVWLYIYPVRGDGLPHARLLGLSQHKLIGWLLLGAAVAHVAVLLIAEPLTSLYLLPSAPAFMIGGLAALILMAVLVQTGLSARAGLRRASPGGVPPAAASTHIVLAAVAAFTLAMHIIGSGQWIAGPAKLVTGAGLLALPIAWFALRRRAGPRRPPPLRAIASFSAGALIVMLPTATVHRWSLQPVTTPAPLELHFPHEKHVSVNCTTCHHNFIDRTGVSNCIDCHRSGRRDLPQSNEATFHVFCRDCHAVLATSGDRHGPTRACSACHSQQAVPGSADIGEPRFAVSRDLGPGIARKITPVGRIAQRRDHPVEQLGELGIGQR